MKKILMTLTTAALAFASLPVLAADNNANPSAPGQDRVCLVTTGKANSWNDVDIVDTKWLPRAAAEAQASKDPTTRKVFDYTNDPLVLNKTYASAEELCKKHFVK